MNCTHPIRVAFLALFAASAWSAPALAQQSIILATTTSTADTGLLDILVPQFEKQTGTEVKIIAVGTGAALRMASTGDADAVLVHSPPAEQKYVDSGDLVEGRQVMHNDFVVVGPADDPAGVGKAKTVEDAMRAIAAGGVFVSRGDDSGTHTKELSLWQAARIDPETIDRREETGQGMGATLNVADQRRAYTLTDRGTYLALRERLELDILFEGDPTLRNIYHAYVVSPQKHGGVKAAAARAFVQFLVTPETQKTIGDFKRADYGQPLFFPDASPQAR